MVNTTLSDSAEGGPLTNPIERPSLREKAEQPPDRNGNEEPA